MNKSKGQFLTAPYFQLRLVSRYFPGVTPKYFLNILMKTVLPVKPHFDAIASTLSLVVRSRSAALFTRQRFILSGSEFPVCCLYIFEIYADVK